METTTIIGFQCNLLYHIQQQQEKQPRRHYTSFISNYQNKTFRNTSKHKLLLPSPLLLHHLRINHPLYRQHRIIAARHCHHRLPFGGMLLECRHTICGSDTSDDRNRWEPDPATLAFPAVRLTVSEFSAHCLAKYKFDPLLSGVDCESEVISLRKFINAKRHRDEPDLAHIFNNWQLGNSGIRKLMFYHNATGGNHTRIESAACAWLKENSETWEPWVRISQPCGRNGTFLWNNETRQCVRAPRNRGNVVVPTLMIIPALSAVGLAIAVYFILAVRSCDCAFCCFL